MFHLFQYLVGIAPEVMFLYALSVTIALTGHHIGKRIAEGGSK